MKKSLLVTLISINCLLSFGQASQQLFDEGKSAFDKEQFEEAYIKFNQSIIVSNNEVILTGLDDRESISKLYYWKALSYSNIDSYDKGRLKGDLEKSLALWNNELALSLFIDIVNTNLDECLKLIRSTIPKTDPKGLYLKALSYAKYASLNDEYKSFIFLEDALKSGYKDKRIILDNSVYFTKINSEKYYNILNNYGIIDSKYEYLIKIFIEDKINKWQVKGKFEKTKDYKNRVNVDTRNLKISELTQYYIDSVGAKRISLNNATNEYDADNEIFKIIFNDLNQIYIPVPINEAEEFDSNFKNLVYESPAFTLYNDNFEILHLEIINPVNNQKYIYDSKAITAFNSNELALNFDDIDIDLSNEPVYNSTNKESTNTISIGLSDVDINIPVTEKVRSNTFALVIGNEDYTKFQNNLQSEVNVDFAKRDAEVFSKYMQKTLGIPKNNIALLTDAISSQMNREIEKLQKLIDYSQGNATVIFYFAGHGFPDEKTKEAFIMPVDVSGTNVKYGINLNDLYKKLTLHPSKKVIVILDACFSGGGRNQGLMAARAVAIKPKENIIEGNLLVFASSTGEQSSLPYKEKQHGIFTYYLLKKLQESKGNITLSELNDYITNEVQLNSIKINSKDQNPSIKVSPSINNKWRYWKF